MKHAENLGIMDSIDWQQFIADLEQQTPGTVAPHTGLGYTPDGDLEVVTKPQDLDATLNTWDKAGYKIVSEGGSAEWQMYYPGINFDESVQTKLMEFSIDTLVILLLRPMLPVSPCMPYSCSSPGTKLNS